MKKMVLSVLAAVVLSGSAFAADMMPKKAVPPPPPPSPWDLAFGSAIMSDYVFRGITQSNHRASVAAYFEPRYNFSPTLQGYVGVAGESISFPNRAAAEIDVYGGIRPTFGPLAFDLGVWYYAYPGGQCYNALVFGFDCFVNSAGFGALFNGNVIKKDLSFWELYAKVTWTINDALSLGGSVFYSPSVLNSGAEGTFAAAAIKYVLPATMLPSGIGMYVSADYGFWWLGTSDPFYGNVLFPLGINYTDYATWDLGVGFTWKVFTLDVRYYDTNLNQGDCNAFTSDHTAVFNASFTPINITGVGSKWCGSTVVVKLSADLTLGSLK